MKVVQEEIFGPVVCAESFSDSDLDRMAREANSTIYGLAASVWTKDLSTAHKMARSSAPVRYGSTATTSSTLPFPLADINNPAGAARWARKSSTTTPK